MKLFNFFKDFTLLQIFQIIFFAISIFSIGFALHSSFSKPPPVFFSHGPSSPSKSLEFGLSCSNPSISDFGFRVNFNQKIKSCSVKSRPFSSFIPSSSIIINENILHFKLPSSLPFNNGEEFIFQLDFYDNYYFPPTGLPFKLSGNSNFKSSEIILNPKVQFASTFFAFNWFQTKMLIWILILIFLCGLIFLSVFFDRKNSDKANRKGIDKSLQQHEKLSDLEKEKRASRNLKTINRLEEKLSLFNSDTKNKNALNFLLKYFNSFIKLNLKFQVKNLSPFDKKEIRQKVLIKLNDAFKRNKFNDITSTQNYLLKAINTTTIDYQKKAAKRKSNLKKYQLLLAEALGFYRFKNEPLSDGEFEDIIIPYIYKEYEDLKGNDKIYFDAILAPKPLDYIKSTINDESKTKFAAQNRYKKLQSFRKKLIKRLKIALHDEPLLFDEKQIIIMAIKKLNGKIRS